jgi:polar amino acid transport system substrate-binding protein
LPVAAVLSRLAGPFVALALAVAGAVLSPMPASAQQEPEFFDEPFAPGQWNVGRRVDPSVLRYCVDPRDPSWEVDGAIADAVAGALLLEPHRYVVEHQIVIEDITKVYELLLKDCDVHMGFKLIPEGYPEWVTLTRGYYETQYVFVAADPAIHALADLPPGHPIGATIGTSAHIRLVSYLTALPADRRWPIYPYGTNELSLESLLNGSVEVALVWAPSLWSKQQTDPAYAGFHVLDPKPLPPTTLDVGGLILKQNTFLRTSIDQAIAALTTDGTIQAILDRYKFPATAKP